MPSLPFLPHPLPSRPMALRFPTEPWCAAFSTAINDNPAYQKHGKPWTFGKVAMVVTKDASLGLEDDVAMVLDVHEGQCRGYVYGQGIATVGDAPFVIVAPMARWREVIEGKLDPIKGMMEGKLKLTTGHLPTMIRFVESSRALVKSAEAVETEFPA